MSLLLHNGMTSVHYHAQLFLVCTGNHRSLCLHGPHFTDLSHILSSNFPLTQKKTIKRTRGNDDNDKPSLKAYWAPVSGLQTSTHRTDVKINNKCTGPNPTHSEVGRGVPISCWKHMQCVVSVDILFHSFLATDFHAAPSSVKIPLPCVQCGQV